MAICAELLPDCLEARNGRNQVLRCTRPFLSCLP